MIKVVPKYTHIFDRNVHLNQYKQIYTILKRFCGQSNNGNQDKEVVRTTELPEEPTTCCMSGCPNCVWLEYADKLSAYFKDGGKQAIKEINEKVQDPNMRAFLFHELRMKKNK